MALAGDEREHRVSEPFPVEDRLVTALEWIATEIVQRRRAQRHERFTPHVEADTTLDEEVRLPVADAERHQVTIVAPVHDSLAGVLLHLSLPQRQHVVPIEGEPSRLFFRPAHPPSLLLHPLFFPP